MFYFYMITIMLAVVLCTVFSYKNGYESGKSVGNIRYGEGYAEGWDAAMSVRAMNEYYENYTDEWGDNPIKPLPLSPDDQADVDEKGDVFRQWYNEEKER